jgi:acetylornithine deacetylase/succinyl-diaminopimelate desuccinylase-like protein
MSEVVAIAQRLVQARSANPPGDTREAAAAVEAELAGVFEVTRSEPVPGFVSVVASHAFSQPGRTLILCGHLDVVPVDPTANGWTRDPWSAEVSDGWLYGRGSLDMKGAVAGMIVAARQAVAGIEGLRGRLVLAAVADEECGGRLGAGTLIQDEITGGDGVVIGEPGDGAICIAHRGMCFVEVTTRGRATHASTGGGVNAVTSMVRVLTALEGIELTHTPHSLLGGPTIAVGTMISGGSTANVIPDVCRATVDIRKVPGMTDESVLADLRNRLAVAGIRDDVALEITTSIEASVTPVTDPIVGVCVDAYLEEFGREPDICGMAAGTDGWWFRNRLGIPTVMALGPGKIEDCHTVNERVSIAELESYSRLYGGIIRRFLGEEQG